MSSNKIKITRVFFPRPSTSAKMNVPTISNAANPNMRTEWTPSPGAPKIFEKGQSDISFFKYKKMTPARIELATSGLEVQRSIQLSYEVGWYRRDSNPCAA